MVVAHGGMREVAVWQRNFLTNFCYRRCSSRIAKLLSSSRYFFASRFSWKVACRVDGNWKFFTDWRISGRYINSSTNLSRVASISGLSSTFIKFLTKSWKPVLVTFSFFTSSNISRSSIDRKSSGNFGALNPLAANWGNYSPFFSWGTYTFWTWVGFLESGTKVILVPYLLNWLD